MRQRRLFQSPANVLALCVSFAFCFPAHAGIEADMASMFNSMGASTNYTEAGSFKNQAMTMYSGGALSVRSPVSNLSPIHIVPPKIEAGCGGIDFFAGSFSFVNKEQFVQFTRNLGNNAAGVAFEIALDSLDPLVGGAIDKIRGIANMMNNFNLNSCQSAKTLVGGLLGAAGESISSQCKATAVADGSVSDGSDASFACQYANKLVEQSQKAIGNNLPGSTITFTGGNLMQQAITNYFSVNNGSFDVNFMTSLTGTLIVKPIKQTDDTEIQYSSEFLPPTITDIKTLIYGNNGIGDEQHVSVELLVCTQGTDDLWDECSRVPTQMSSIRYQIREVLRRWVAAIQADSGVSPADNDRIIGLIENTQLPLMKIAINDAVLGTSMIEQYIDVITVEYMASYLAKLERGVRGALGRYKKFDAASQADVDRMYQTLGELRATLSKERNEVYAKASAENTVVSYLKNFENHWRGNFPGTSRALEFDLGNRF